MALKDESVHGRFQDSIFFLSQLSSGDQYVTFFYSPSAYRLLVCFSTIITRRFFIFYCGYGILKDSGVLIFGLIKFRYEISKAYIF